jgi:hypothetical protein
MAGCMPHKCLRYSAHIACWCNAGTLYHPYSARRDKQMIIIWRESGAGNFLVLLTSTVCEKNIVTEQGSQHRVTAMG